MGEGGCNDLQRPSYTDYYMTPTQTTHEGVSKLIKISGLYELWKTGRYKSYPAATLVYLVARILKNSISKIDKAFSKTIGHLSLNVPLL